MITKDSLNKISNQQWCVLVITLFIGFHLLYIQTPFVNYEWSYRTGSKYILTGDISILDKDLASYSDKITLLDNDTNNIVEYVDNDKSNLKKNYHFWDLLKKNDK